MKRLTFDSPIGRLTATVKEEALCAIYFENHRSGLPIGNDDSPLLRETRTQLVEYFTGRRQSFHLPLAPQGSEFQRAVWRELLRIPFGQTCSYGAIAKRVGGMEKVRAVGGAIGRNPIGIVIPCHRVIGASGKLVGFGGGLPTKEFLLSLESPEGELPFTSAPAKLPSQPIG